MSARVPAKETSRVCSALVGRGHIRDSLSLLGAEFIQFDANFFVAQCKDGHGQQRRIDCAGFADRKRTHRYAWRHLDDRIQRILATQCASIQWHTQHGQCRMGRSYSG